MKKDCPKDCHEPNALIFRKIVIPASVADDSVNPPKNGDYCNALVVYEATGNAYLFSSDGTWVMLSANSVEMMKALDREISDREEADTEIWNEIETIEAASDVVDVVGTYAELQQYDTSKLNDNDLIKVLADETRDDAITYYRWSTATDTFTYVGSEGPYYTSSEVDTLLAGKQGTLTAGSNITIASDNTISATDTTYNVFSVGSNGLVPAPTVGDANKALKGDGTWGEVSSGAIFYMNASESGSTRHLYKSPDMTGLATMQDIIDANEEGQVIVRISTSADPASYSDMYLQNAYVATGDYQMIFLDNQYYYGFDTTLTSDNTFQFSKRELQTKLTAGTNIQINGNTISATDTTYTHFTGATASTDGVQGLVPGPLAGDQDKFLKADGTWATVQSGGSSITLYYVSNGALDSTNVGSTFPIYKDFAMTTEATADEFFASVRDGEVRLVDGGFNLYYVNYDMDNDQDYGGNADNYYSIVKPVLGTSSGDTIYIINWEGSGLTIAARPTLADRHRLQSVLTAGSNISISTVSGVPNTISVTGMPVLYGSQGQNTDGSVTQKLFTDTVGDVESILQILNSGAGV